MGCTARSSRVMMSSKTNIRLRISSASSALLTFITTNVRMKDVEDSQQRIVGIIRDLEEKGEIVILKGGKWGRSLWRAEYRLLTSALLRKANSRFLRLLVTLSRRLMAA